LDGAACQAYERERAGPRIGAPPSNKKNIDGMSMEQRSEFMEMTAGIVSAYVAGNIMAAAEVPGLIRGVHAALAGLSGPGSAPPSPAAEPAVSIKRSITPDHLICLEDGRKFKSLKRHLQTKYGMTPEQYRAKWGLPSDYPMVAPNYARARSDLAKEMGLGRSGRKSAPKARLG